MKTDFLILASPCALCAMTVPAFLAVSPALAQSGSTAKDGVTEKARVPSIHLPPRPANIPDGECLIPEERRGNSDWFQKSGWGIFVHYLEHLQNSGKRENNMGKTTGWDACVNEFDVEKFAEQVKGTGAPYVMFTVTQLEKHMCAPNATYDRLIGPELAKNACSKRDLIKDVHQALHKRGIRLMLYWTGDGPKWDGEVMKKLDTGRGFIRNWADIAAEYGERYKDKVDGWWVDGCHYADEKTHTILAEGMRAGNPKRIVALNHGCARAYSRTLNDDYTPGEINDLGGVPSSRWRDGVQWHLLSFLGGYWGSPGVRYKPDWLADYIHRVNRGGGVITLDVELFRDGTINSAQLEALKEMNRKLQALNARPEFPAPTAGPQVKAVFSAAALEGFETTGSPARVRESPEKMTGGGRESFRFAGTNDCFKMARRVTTSDVPFLLETWAKADRANMPGLHGAASVGNGARGYTLAQQGGDWVLFVGGVGGVKLGPVTRGKWTHLAVFVSGDGCDAYLNGAKVGAADLSPEIHPNFSIGDMGGGKEHFAGVIHFVRVVEFPGIPFSPARDLSIKGRHQ